MKILAIEFSSAQRSVAALDAAGHGPAFSAGEAVGRGAGTEDALGLVEQALRLTGLEREQVECIAVGLGPGSYTGIRSAIALAQGWQLARDIKMAGISSADVIAAQARAEGVTGRVGVVIDAQRGELYLAEYDLAAEGWRQTAPLRLADLAEARAIGAAGPALLIGPEVQSWCPQGRTVFPSASMLARLAVQRTEFVPGEKLEPIYLREPAFVKAPPPRSVP